MMRRTIFLSSQLWIFLLFVLVRDTTSAAFVVVRSSASPSHQSASAICLGRSTASDDSVPIRDRRCALERALAVVAAASTPPFWMAPNQALAAAAMTSLDKLLDDLKKARKQMEPIPDLIKKEQWDSVRAILITPPLSDLWTKSARPRSFLKEYADAVGDNPAGDELAVLEAKEDVQSHLRYLDMAVYNNVFNPIKTEGETGATKLLIQSYYEDPVNEFKASIASLEELIKLGDL